MYICICVYIYINYIYVYIYYIYIYIYIYNIQAVYNDIYEVALPPTYAPVC